MKSTDILRIERTDKDEHTYVIRWHMTHLCNYYCDFCIQGNRERHMRRAQGESAQMRKRICSNLIAFIEKELNGKADILFLYLIGGEVTILEDFVSIVRRLLRVKFQGKIQMHFTTNFSMSKKMCRKLATIAMEGRDRKITVRCNYYKEFTDEEHFMEKIKALSDKSGYQKFLMKYMHRNKISFTIGYPLFEDQDYTKYLRFCENNPQYASRVIPFTIRDYKTSVSQSVIEKLRADDEKNKIKSVRVVWKNGAVKYFSETADPCLFADEGPYFRPKGFLCDIGRRFLTIDPFGNMSRCVEAAEETKFGNLCDEVPRYMTEMLRCPAERCGCRFYSLLENDM